MRARIVVGVDGCAEGWIAVAVRVARGDVCGAAMHATFDGVLAAWPGAEVIGVDMPIGLVARGLRDADLAAQAFLRARGRSSSVFVVPPRPVLRATSHREACRLAMRYAETGISMQCFRLFPKILEVDRHVDDSRLVEVHPEVSFAVIASGGARTAGEAPLARKKSWSGAQARRRLLERHGIVVPDAFAGSDRAGVDDVLDAAAVAWTARRVARGEAASLPASPASRDACGRAIRIVA